MCEAQQAQVNVPALIKEARLGARIGAEVLMLDTRAGPISFIAVEVCLVL